MTLRANGIAGPIGLGDAWEIAGILEATGRTIPRDRWVDELVHARNRASFEGLG